MNVVNIVNVARTTSYDARRIKQARRNAVARAGPTIGMPFNVHNVHNVHGPGGTAASDFAGR